MSENPEMHVIQRLVLSSLILMHTTGLSGEATAPPCIHALAHSAQTTATADGSHKRKQIQFKIVLAGEIEDEDKVHLAITNYIASDGVGLTVIHGEFLSRVAAQEY